jgi:hypothetical protein
VRQELPRLGVLCSIIFLAYGLANRQFVGPAYLSDELGYLSKAAVLSGWPNDLATGWHGGYSFFLIPAFLLNTEPSDIFQSVVLTNILLWCLAFVALWSLLGILYPQVEPKQRILATGLCALYPAFLVSSGYAISTGAVVLLITVSALSISSTGWAGLCLHSTCVGLVFWCHPTGLAIAVASLLAQLIVNARPKRTLFSALVMGLVIAAYKFGLDPWFLEQMNSNALGPTGSGSAGGSYTTSGLTASLQTSAFYTVLPVMLMGQVSYFLISTFGIGFFGVLTVLRKFGESPDKEKRILVYLVLNLAGLIALGSLFLTKLTTEHRTEGIHTWFYGRYLEAALLPLLAIGLLGEWPRKYGLAAAGQVIATAGLLHLTITEQNTRFTIVHLNIQGFWPLALLPDGPTWLWLVLGSIGVVLVTFMGKKHSAFLIVPLVLLLMNAQLSDHRRILSDYSRPNDLRKVVQTLYTKGTPFNFDNEILEDKRSRTDYTRPRNLRRSFFANIQSNIDRNFSKKVEKRERRAYYSFYLYDYPGRRTDFEEWLKNPVGPFLTFDPKKAKSQRVRTVALEHKTGMMMLIAPADFPRSTTYPGPTRGLTVDLDGSNGLQYGCFSLKGADLAVFSSTGTTTQEGMKTDGKGGTLFYGPYLPLEAGLYDLTLRGRFPNPAGAVLDVSSETDGDIRLRFELPATDQLQNLTHTFALPVDVKQLEVRLFVNPESDLLVESYSVTPNTIFIKSL